MSPSPSTADWARLGELLTRRRVELDPRYQNRTVFSAERGIDYRLAYDIEECRRTNFRTTTLAAVAAAYGVTYESLMQVAHEGAAELIPASGPVTVSGPVAVYPEPVSGSPAAPPPSPDPEPTEAARKLFPGDLLLQLLYSLPSTEEKRAGLIEETRRQRESESHHGGSRASEESALQSGLILSQR